MRRIPTLLLATLALTLTLPALTKDVKTHAAPPGTWQVIGHLEANHQAEHDSLEIKGQYDNFRRLKLRVKDAPLNIRRMVITFDGGGVQNVEQRNNIPKGGESRVIDLKGDSRSLRRIDFWYDTIGQGHGKADLTVLGRK